MAKKKHGPEYIKPLPTRLRYQLDLQRVKQKELSEYLHKSPQSVSCYCDGTNQPDPDTLTQIAKFFQVSTDYLLGLSNVSKFDANAKAASQYTGLSEQAVLNLHGLANVSGSDLAIIDKMLSNLAPNGEKV